MSNDLSKMEEGAARKRANNNGSNGAPLSGVGTNIYKGGKKSLSSAQRVLNDFKVFIKRGNVFDIAVGLVISAAFTTVVTSLVEDLIAPLIGLIRRGNLGNLFIVLRCPPVGDKDGPIPPLRTCQNNWSTFADAQKDGAITWNWGNFLQKLINFWIVAFIIFLLVKAYAAAFLRKEDVETKDCEECTKTIPQKAKRCPECTAVLQDKVFVVE